MFNLLPVPPLDGSGILAGLSWKWYQWSQDPRIAMYSLLALMVLFFMGGLGGVLFGTAMTASGAYSGMLTRLIWGGSGAEIPSDSL